MDYDVYEMVWVPGEEIHRIGHAGYDLAQPNYFVVLFVPAFHFGVQIRGMQTQF